MRAFASERMTIVVAVLGASLTSAIYLISKARVNYQVATAA